MSTWNGASLRKAAFDCTDTAQLLVPSDYARNAKAAGLDIITWSLERSGLVAGNSGDFYYQTFGSGVKREGDMMQVLDVLAQQVGILGIFSDWPATATFYANCARLK